jgi:hypothetical protein
MNCSKIHRNFKTVLLVDFYLLSQFLFQYFFGDVGMLLFLLTFSLLIAGLPFGGHQLDVIDYGGIIAGFGRGIFALGFNSQYLLPGLNLTNAKINGDDK